MYNVLIKGSSGNFFVGQLAILKTDLKNPNPADDPFKKRAKFNKEHMGLWCCGVAFTNL